jgi:SAM-dependent methyltransferase
MNFRENLLKIINKPAVQAIIYSRFLDYHQWSLRTFVAKNAKKIKPDQTVIDIGAGELRYKQYFNHCKYTSQDLCVGDNNWDFSHIDIKSTVYSIPVSNESFDYILCTQVLEHLEYPEKAFQEFNRILKKGGKLILTAPLGQGEHQTPYDFFRYTQYGLKSLGERVGLKLKIIEPQGGVFINLEYILWWGIMSTLPFKNNILVRYSYHTVSLPIKFITGLVFYVIDYFDTKKNYTNNYNCIYEK